MTTTQAITAARHEYAEIIAEINTRQHVARQRESDREYNARLHQRAETIRREFGRLNLALGSAPVTLPPAIAARIAGDRRFFIEHVPSADGYDHEARVSVIDPLGAYAFAAYAKLDELVAAATTREVA